MGQDAHSNVKEIIDLLLSYNASLFFWVILAHLSRRLIGEIIIYEGIRRPS